MNRVVPTDRSVAAYSKIKAVAGDVFEDALQGVDEAHRQALMTALATMITNLSADDAPAAEIAQKILASS